VPLILIGYCHLWLCFGLTAATCHDSAACGAHCFPFDRRIRQRGVHAQKNAASQDGARHGIRDCREADSYKRIVVVACKQHVANMQVCRTDSSNFRASYQPLDNTMREDMSALRLNKTCRTSKLMHPLLQQSHTCRSIVSD
jgi:hypothetical protein